MLLTLLTGLYVFLRKPYSDFLQTAKFLEIIRDWWNSFNLKAPNIGFNKGDPNREPVTVENLEEKTKHFRKIFDWLDLWQQNCKKNNLKQNGSSEETFVTFKQTTSCNFNFVLTGKIQSDPLEGRFGWWRQSCGGNY